MKTLLLILLIMTGISTTDLRAGQLVGIPNHYEGEVRMDISKLIVIFDCTLNSNYNEMSDSEINNMLSRSFYPANSLNVLKKAYYAFDVRPSDITNNTVAG